MTRLQPTSVPASSQSGLFYLAVTTARPSPTRHMETWGTALLGGGRYFLEEHSAGGGQEITTHKQDLRALANWLLLRSVQDHDRKTTLTILSRKVAALRAKKYEHDIFPTHDKHSHAENSTAGEM